MTRPRYEVIFDHLAPFGTKRWVIYDTHERAWVDEPRYDCETAEDVCCDLNEFGVKE